MPARFSWSQGDVDAFEVTDEGYAGNSDAVAGATIHVSYYVEAIEDALSR